MSEKEHPVDKLGLNHDEVPVKRFGESLFLTIEEFFNVIADISGKSIDSLVVPETNADKHILSAKTGSMVSLIEINGISTIKSKKDFIDMVDTIENKLSPYLGKHGYYAQFVMHYNPRRSRQEIDRSIEPMKKTAQTIGLDLDFIFDDWGKKLSEWTAYEKVYLAVWTRPDVLTSHVNKSAKKEMTERASNTSLSKKAMEISSYIPALKNEHKAHVSGFKTALDSGGIIYNELDCHQALWVMRSEVDSAATSPDWKAFLNGDNFIGRVKNRIDKMNDLENVLYPKISSQIVPRDPVDLNTAMTQIGEELHHPLALNIPPQKPETFNSLLSILVNKDFPWRLSFGINGGLPGFGIKGFLSGMFAKTSIDNKLLNNAIEYLNQLAVNSESIVEFKASFDTWVYAYEENAEQKLKSQASELMSAIQSWGNTEVTDVIGHPTLGTFSTIPGMLDYIPSNGAGAPLHDIVKMMPLVRPASPWDRGSTPFRTPCGKIFPYQQGSAAQAAWIDVGFAPMGFGKSVQLNTLNFSFLIEPGLRNLPWVSMLDIGPSSKGMVNLIRAGLPDNMKHIAVYHRLRMDEKNTVNPMDTPVGLRKPFISHKTFLVNLFTLFATPIGQDSAPEGIDDIASRAIDLAYENFSDENSPKLYKTGVMLDVDDEIQKHEFEIDEDTTWFEVTDMFSKKGEFFFASRAHRMAMPLLSEVANASKHPTITNLYSHKLGDENIVNYFWRNCIKAINAYSILKGYTKLDLSEARVVSLDLDEVAIKGGETAERQTAVMYMIGRHLVASKFFFMPDDAKSIKDPVYHKYHMDKINSLRDDPKRLNYDEVHRVTKAVSSASVTRQLVADITTAIRESRKWKLHLGLYSQGIDDIPSDILNLATSVYVMGVGSTEEVDKVGQKLGLSEAEKSSIKSINKPGKKGSTFLGIFKTDRGEIKQKLMNTLGSVMLWGFSSTWDDNRVREKVIERLGIREGLKILSKIYPGGTVGSEVTRRKLKYADEGKSIDIPNEIADELIDLYYRAVINDE